MASRNGFLRLGMAVTAVTACSAAAFAQTNVDQRVKTGTSDTHDMQGERLTPDMLGPGVIETMDQVIERDQLARLNGPVNNRERGDAVGQWIIPGPRALATARSGRLHLVNKWGDNEMGIGFGRIVQFDGAWIGGQAGEGSWAEGIRFVGFRDGVEVASTEWSEPLDQHPRWIAADFVGVDRIEVHALPVAGGAGWYALDDLTYTIDGKQVVVNFEDGHTKQNLTGSDFADLDWEAGAGVFGAAQDDAMPPPVEMDEDLDDTPGEVGTASPLTGGNGTTPTLIDDFQGVIRGDSGQGSFPPDTHGSVGPAHFLEVVNRNFSVYAKNSGTRLIDVSLGSFQPGTSGDPRVLFDQHSNRWIVVSTDFDDTIFLAVSLTDSATGAFFKTSFLASTGSDSACFPDFPTLGVDEDGIYVTASMFGSGCARTIWAIDKAPLIASTPSLGAVTAFRGLSDSLIQPCHTFGTPGSEFFVSMVNNQSSQMRVRRISGSLTNPTLSFVATATIPSHSAPPDAVSQGSGTPLDTGDRRIGNAVYRDGFIWCANTINLGGRAAIRWYRLSVTNTSASLTMNGTVNDPTLAYFYPGITVNASGDVLLGFSGTSASQAAACYYAGRRINDPSGQMSDPELLRSGNGGYNLVDGFGRNRWGDYSFSSVDPEDGVTFWTVQEYTHSTDVWGTQIAKLAYQFPPSNDLCAAAQPIPNGDTPFDTTDATFDGPVEPGCGPSPGKDIWYRAQAPGDGTLVISTCGASFNTWVAVYGVACPTGPGELLACNDNACGQQAEVLLPVTGGQVVTIRIGGVNGAGGTGTLSVNLMAEPSCPADLNGDDVVDTGDLLLLLANWNTDGPGADLSAPEDVVDTADLLALLAEWGVCN